MSREVEFKFENKETPEGKDVKVRRSIGSYELPNFDPFLLLDEAKAKAPAGFPPHPHRGFQAVSYIIKGSTVHEDFCGHKGFIKAGGLQWMTAGKGIVHCEMPFGEETIHGFQLWVNLSKKDKMCEPNYQDLKDSDIPKTSNNGVHVKILAGESMGVKSPVFTSTPTMYLDFKVDQGASFTQPIPENWNAFIYVISGTGLFGSKNKLLESDAHYTLLLSKGDSVYFKNEKPTQLHFLLIGGQPLNEPIARRGPFVMNTDEELQNAFKDYQNCQNGFEKRLNWTPDILKQKA